MEWSAAGLPVKRHHLTQVYCVSMAEKHGWANILVGQPGNNNFGFATPSSVCSCVKMQNLTIQHFADLPASHVGCVDKHGGIYL